jgi:CBS-domain-containing membrane protein
MSAKNTMKVKRTVVADWMSEAVLAVETFDSINVARQLMAKHRINQLPVLENDELVGIVTDRDIRDAYPTSMAINRGEAIDRFAETITVEEVMSQNVLTVEPETSLAAAVELLRKQRIGSLPVVKKHKLVGIITRSDILDFVRSQTSSAAERKRTGSVKIPAKKKSAKPPRATHNKKVKEMF